MDLRERVLHRVGQLLLGLRACGGRLADLRGIERLAGDAVGECGRHAPVVHGRLRALGLQLVEDLRELRDLRLREVQLVGEETQRAAHTESATAIVVTACGGVAFTAAAPVSTAGAAGCFLRAATFLLLLPPPREHRRMNVSSVHWVLPPVASPRIRGAFCRGGNRARRVFSTAIGVGTKPRRHKSSLARSCRNARNFTFRLRTQAPPRPRWRGEAVTVGTAMPRQSSRRVPAPAWAYGGRRTASGVRAGVRRTAPSTGSRVAHSR